MRTSSCWMITAAIALAAALTGCSTSSSEEPPQAAVATYPLTLEMREIDQIVAIRDVAIEIETERCMIDLGFPRVDRVSFAQNRARLSSEPLQEWTNVRPDTASAANLGFGALPIATLIEESNEAPTYPELDAMSEAEQQNWHTALLGTPDETATYSGPNGISGGFSTGGCYGTARLELFQSAEGGFGSFLVQRSMLDNLRNDAYNRTLSSKAVRDALEEWRLCMSQAGFADYQNPNEVVPTLAQLSASGDRDSETTLAVADAQCFDQSRLIETWDIQMAGFESELAQSDEFLTVRSWGDSNYQLLVDAFSPLIAARENGTG